jgi:hypothetical protein
MFCKNMQGLKVWTHDQAKRAIDENKWYLSERQHYDVGFSEAERDFLDNYCSECGARWRVKYCQDICEFFVDCELGKKMVKRDKNGKTNTETGNTGTHKD